MDQYINLFIRAAFVENLALTFFLGMCTFLAISKRVETAIGLGVAVVVIQVITVPVNYLIFTYLLKAGAPELPRTRLLHRRDRGTRANPRDDARSARAETV
jgi:Na+-transporting NADH:ubiquinone oxidoreductase subunit NqrE